MGYTHYWRANAEGSYDVSSQSWNQANRTKLEQAIKDISRLVSTKPGLCALAGTDGEGDPEISDTGVCFNGVGEAAHEAFEISVGWGGRFDFCKTAHKPYDAMVTACLCILKARLGDAVQISSDGDVGDWEEGLKLARILVPEAEVPFTDR